MQVVAMGLLVFFAEAQASALVDELQARAC